MNIITVAENAMKCTRLGKKCQHCASSVLNIKFNDGDEVTCCVFCDMDYNRFVYRPEIKVAQKPNKDEDRSRGRNQNPRDNTKQMVDNKKTFNAKVGQYKARDNSNPGRNFGSDRGGNSGPRGRGGSSRGGAMKPGMGRGGARENNNQRNNDSYAGGKHVQIQPGNRGGFGSNQNRGGRGGSNMRGGNDNRRSSMDYNGGTHNQGHSQKTESRGPFNNLSSGNMVTQSNVNYQQNLGARGGDGVGMRSKNIAKGNPGLGMGSNVNNKNTSPDNMMGARQGMQQKMGNAMPNHF